MIGDNLALYIGVRIAGTKEDGLGFRVPEHAVHRRRGPAIVDRPVEHKAGVLVSHALVFVFVAIQQDPSRHHNQHGSE